jgi:hypothetical protein
MNEIENESDQDNNDYEEIYKEILNLLINE